MPKRTLNDYLSDPDKSWSRDDFAARELRKRLWVASAHHPGCLNDWSSPCRYKSEAICAAIDWAGDDVPRGFVGDLRRTGSAGIGVMIVEVEQFTLSDLF